MKGYRTLLVGLGMAVAPVALQYLVNVDWTQFVSPNSALIISGLLMMGMRLLTSTPPGSKY